MTTETVPPFDPDKAPKQSDDRGLLRRWWSMSPDEPRKTIAVVLIICVFFAVIVSVTSVSLLPLQELNKAQEKQRNILQVAGMYSPGVDIEKAFERVEARLVDLRSNTFSDDFDPKEWDPQLAAEDPDLSSAQLPSDAPVGVYRMPHYATIYFVKRDGVNVVTVIFPIYGYGLWSVLWGFVAVKVDMNEIVGLRFYQQLETAGLGGEVDNPKWQAKWPGKKIRDEQGNYKLHLSKVDTESVYTVEALSGATMTSRGVDNMLRFWLGSNGFKPLMDKLKQDIPQGIPS